MVNFAHWVTVVIAAHEAVYAHPGQSLAEKKAELKIRSDYIRSLEKQDLAHCAKRLKKRGHVQAMSERRIQTLNEIRTFKDLDATGKQLE
jgi:hypothetical protein